MRRLTYHAWGRRIKLESRRTGLEVGRTPPQARLPGVILLDLQFFPGPVP